MSKEFFVRDSFYMSKKNEPESGAPLQKGSDRTKSEKTCPDNNASTENLLSLKSLKYVVETIKRYFSSSFQIEFVQACYVYSLLAFIALATHITYQVRVFFLPRMIPWLDIQ